MIDDIQPAFAADAAALNPGLLEAAGETSDSGGADLWSAAPDTAELVALLVRSAVLSARPSKSCWPKGFAAKRP